MTVTNVNRAVTRNEHYDTKSRQRIYGANLDVISVFIIHREPVPEPALFPNAMI